MMKAPAVSGARDYQELSMAAKNEEHRLDELSKRQQYLRDGATDDSTDQQHKRQGRMTQGRQSQSNGASSRPPWRNSGKGIPPRDPTNSASSSAKRCYICNSTSHLAKHCNKTAKSESTGKSQPPKNNNSQNKAAAARKVQSEPSENAPKDESQDVTSDLMDILYSSSESDDGYKGTG